MGLTNPVVLVGFVVAISIILLRYYSLSLIPSGQDNKKEVAMKKTLTFRIRLFISSIYETLWATGVGSAVVHLST